MITFFTIPKPFTGHSGVIQKNALRSWSMLPGGCEILIMGDEPGSAGFAREIGARYLPEIRRNEYGTPLVSDAFALAEKNAIHDVLCYVNADIILADGMAAVAEQASALFPKFLIIGCRMDIELDYELVYNRNWHETIHAIVKSGGHPHDLSGIDYFIFRKGTLGKMLDFAVGRPAWDNWTIYQARKSGLPVIDASDAILAVHQSHGYGHVPQGSGKIWDGPESKDNWKLSGGFCYLFTMLDATHVARAGAIKRALDWRHTLRRAKAALLLQPRLYTLLLDIAERWRRNWKKVTG